MCYEEFDCTTNYVSQSLTSSDLQYFTFETFVNSKKGVISTVKTKQKQERKTRKKKIQSILCLSFTQIQGILRLKGCRTSNAIINKLKHRRQISL